MNVKVKVPKGTTNVSHGGKAYQVSGDTVDVPEDVADALVKTNGFVRAPTDAEVKDAALKK